MTLAVSIGGGAAVGQHVAPAGWMSGTWEITQGWGPSNYAGEPEGHGYRHWHAGVDVGCSCGTLLTFPANLYGVARWVDNPSGYGTALRLELYTYAPVGKGLTRRRTWDVWLGHLRQRLVPAGTELRPGMHIAITNNTGNSTGCHLHFEVRPAGARYGTDVDPSQLLLSPEAAPADTSSSNDGNPYNVLDPRHGYWELEHQLSAGITSAESTLLGVGQAGLGATMLLGGLVVVAFGLRGRSAAQLGSSVRATVGKVRRTQAAGELTQERTQQGAIARDVAEQTTEQRAAAAERAGLRRNTLGAYRAGLISRRVAQERLGERVAATGRRPKRVAYGRGISGPGIYRRRGQTVEVKDPTIIARRSRVRVSHQRDFKVPPAPPQASVGEIPF